MYLLGNTSADKHRKCTNVRNLNYGTFIQRCPSTAGIFFLREHFTTQAAAQACLG